MTGWLDGSVALVVGGGSGIGAGVVDAFVAEGALVSVLDLSQERAEAVCGRHGERALAIGGDATQGAQASAAVESTVRRFGRLDSLVVSVGLFDYYVRLEDLTADQLSIAFDEIVTVNVKAALLCVQAAAPALQRSGGNVVLTLSAAAFHAGGGGALYGASKWAGRGLVTHLARELAPQVRVNGVAPCGTSDTPMAGLRSLGQQPTADSLEGRDERIKSATALGLVPTRADHAWAFVYLASATRARAVTGAVVNTDAGLGLNC